MQVQGDNSMRSRLGAAVRPTVLFVVAYAFNISPHEAVHALVSYGLGFSSTLFQMWVDPHAATATPGQLALIAFVGPVFSLLVGSSSWWLYKVRRQTPSALFFLMMALVGIYSFLGPLAGAAFGGDFHTALNFMSVLPAPEYVLSAVGVVLLAVFMFYMGIRLSDWAPASYGRLANVACISLAPWLIGALLIILLYSPLPHFLIGSVIFGSSFWVFAVIGAAVSFRKRQISDSILSLRWPDLVITVAAVVMVRILARGIPLVH
jgi:hypothetical protein